MPNIVGAERSFETGGGGTRAFATPSRAIRRGGSTRPMRTYRAVLDDEPDNADAVNLLGVLCVQRGRTASPTSPRPARWAFGNRPRDPLRRRPGLWTCGQRFALPTTPQAPHQQKRSIDVLHKPVNLTRHLQPHPREAATRSALSAAPRARSSGILVIGPAGRARGGTVLVLTDNC